MKVGWGTYARIRSGTRCRLDVSAATTRVTRRQTAWRSVRTVSYVTGSSKAKGRTGRYESALRFAARSKARYLMNRRRFPWLRDRAHVYLALAITSVAGPVEDGARLTVRRHQAGTSGRPRGKPRAPLRRRPGTAMPRSHVPGLSRDQSYKGTRTRWRSTSARRRQPSAARAATGLERSTPRAATRRSSGDSRRYAVGGVSDTCTSCHNRATHALWDGSQHDQRNLGCTTLPQRPRGEGTAAAQGAAPSRQLQHLPSQRHEQAASLQPHAGAGRAR